MLRRRDLVHQYLRDPNRRGRYNDLNKSGRHVINQA